VSRLIDILADHAAEIDEIADDLLSDYVARIREIVSTPGERDPDVYALYDADDDLTIEQFAAVPRAERNQDWLERLASYVTAARMQAFAELILPRLLETAESHGEQANSEARKLDITEAREAAREGISKEAVSFATRQRQAAKAQALEAAAAKELL
jgi:hypothetical protein